MLDRVIEMVLIKELLCTSRRKCVMPFRFHNSKLAATLLLSLVLAFGSTSMAASAAKKVSIIFADFSERSGLLFVAKDQGFFAEHVLDADIVQVRGQYAPLTSLFLMLSR
jgi:ABC-type nitrate/sulfonate/bicarbonate transport system substrate-binding protein